MGTMADDGARLTRCELAVMDKNSLHKLVLSVAPWEMLVEERLVLKPWLTQDDEVHWPVALHALPKRALIKFLKDYKKRYNNDYKPKKAYVKIVQNASKKAKVPVVQCAYI